MKQYFAQTLQIISFKMTYASCMEEVREKVTHFKKSHFFYDINHNTEPLSINVFVCLKLLPRYKKNKPQKFCFHRTRRFCYSTT